MSSDNVEDDLDLLYSPSAWSNFGNKDEVIEAFLTNLKSFSEDAKRIVSYKLNIKYGPGAGQLLDDFGVDLVDSSTLVVFIHGGCWVEGSKDIYGGLALGFHSSNIRLLIAGYDLAPAVTVDKIVRQMKDLMDFLSKFVKTNRIQKVWLVGHSAGGHLAASVLPESGDLLTGVILISGLFDLNKLLPTYIAKDAHITSEIARNCSPLFLDKPTEAMTRVKYLIIVGEHESPAFKQQSAEYAKFLIGHGCQVTEMIVDGVDHFSIITNLCKPTNELNLFIKQKMRN